MRAQNFGRVRTPPKGRLGAVAGSLAVLLLAIAQPVASDVRRMEAVGAEPVRIGTKIRVPLRDAALKRALRDAVVRVALDLVAVEIPFEDKNPGTSPDFKNGSWRIWLIADLKSTSP